jgi:hypothetical protein
VIGSTYGAPTFACCPAANGEAEVKKKNLKTKTRKRKTQLEKGKMQKPILGTSQGCQNTLCNPADENKHSFTHSRFFYSLLITHSRDLLMSRFKHNCF